jgi:cytochrome c biogenesis protein CcmG, thiol:disulfide interchange protein DsbE
MSATVQPRRLVSVVVAGLLAGLLLLKFRDQGPLIDEPAPRFSLPLVHDQGRRPDHERVRLEDLRGQFLVLDFWASWCGPCRHSVGILNRVAGELASENVRVYGVNAEGLSPIQVANVSRAWGIAYPVLHDPTAATQLAYEVSALPTLFLVDRSGVVRARFDGAPGAEHLIARIRELAR